MEGYAMIIGATSGVGYGFAKSSGPRVCNVVRLARSEEVLRALAANLARVSLTDVPAITKELFTPTAAEEIHAELHAKRIIVDVLVKGTGRASMKLAGIGTGHDISEGAGKSDGDCEKPGRAY